MTKKHFEFVAATIAAMPAFSPSLRDQRRSCALAFAKALEATNPNFNRERFLQAACEVNDKIINDHFNEAKAEMNK